MSRVSVLLTGLHDEWMALLPVDSPDDVPLTRWADLWSRALLGCSGVVDVPEAVRETGRFSAYALELVHHDHAAAAVCWGVWDVGGDAHPCRLTLSAWRVPAVPVEEALLAAHGPLLRALADGLSWAGEGDRGSTGDLRLRGGAPGPAADPMEVAKRAVALPLPARPGVDRHPAQLALPVYVEQKLGPTVTLAGVELPVRFDRCGVAQGIAADSGAERWVGLLRWDAGAWSVQPLGGVSGGKKPARLGPHAVLQAGAKSKSDVLATLRERAGRLLRKKS